VLRICIFPLYGPNRTRDHQPEGHANRRYF